MADIISCHIVSFIVVGIATKYFEAFKYFYPIGIWIGFVVMWGLIITIAIWQIVGLWRSAKNYQKRNAFNKKYYFGSLAKVAVFFGAMQFVVVAESAIPQFKEISSIAFDGDPTIPSYKLSITQGATELKIEGGLKYGLTKEVEKLLAAAPEIRTIDLESVGGRVGIANDLFDIIQKKGLNTVTNDYCVSACAFAFAAGKNRWLGVGAKLGFHSIAFPGMSQNDIAAETRDIHERIHKLNGTSLEFLRQGAAYPPSKMWYPSRADLLNQHYITSFRSGAKSTASIFEIAMSNVILEQKKKFPIAVDEYTVLSDMLVDGTKIIYVYELSNDFLSSIGTRINDLNELLRKDTIAKNCKNQLIKEKIDEGLVYGYLYLNQKKQRVLYFEYSGC